MYSFVTIQSKIVMEKLYQTIVNLDILDLCAYRAISQLIISNLINFNVAYVIKILK